MKTINNSTTTNYSNTHKTSAKEDLELAKEMMTIASCPQKDIVDAREEVIKAKEETSKSVIEMYSNEKGIKQNKMYEVYMEGAIEENFRTATKLQEDILKLKTEKLDAEIAIAKKQSEAEIEIAKKKADAQIELDVLEKKIKLTRMGMARTWIYRIAWPLIGVLTAVLTFVLLYVIK